MSRPAGIVFRKRVRNAKTHYQQGTQRREMASASLAGTPRLGHGAEIAPNLASHPPASTTEPAASLPLRRVFPFILLPIFLAVVDGTIVAAALPAMAGAFGEVERVSWVVASYLVASTAAAPVYGRLGDAWGRKRLLLAALGLLIAASAMCASANGILSLTMARAKASAAVG
jgi:hypothetical protein